MTGSCTNRVGDNCVALGERGLFVTHGSERQNQSFRHSADNGTGDVRRKTSGEEGSFWISGRARTQPPGGGGGHWPRID